MGLMSWNNFFVLTVLASIVSIGVKIVYFPKQLSIVNEPSGKYDYIVVGAGTAGSVLAGQLSAGDPGKRVLLIEAGAWDSWISRIPGLAPLQMLTDAIWDYETEPEKFSHWGYHDRECNVPRGKFIGGSGGMNFHIHNVSFLEKNPLLKDALFTPKRSESVLLDAFLNSAKSVNKGEFSPISSLIKNGKRHGAADIFLKPNMNRPNLNVMINTEVMSFQVDDKTGSAHKLTYSKKRKIYSFDILGAKVILAAGSLNTPLLLLRSGFGPKQNLQQFEIPVVKELPVGKTLKDSIMYPIYFHTKDPNVRSINMMRILNPMEIYDYVANGEGIWSTMALDGQALFRDEGIIVLLYELGAPSKLAFTTISGHTSDTFDAMFPDNSNPWKEGFVLLASCLESHSDGSVSLTRMVENEGSPLKIFTDYFESPKDMSCMKKAVRNAIKIGQSDALKKLGAELHVPDFEECKKFKRDYADEDYLECAIRTAATTMYHPVGTTPVGPVLEKDFRVKGINNVYVSDSAAIEKLRDEFPNAKVINMALDMAQKLKNSKV